MGTPARDDVTGSAAGVFTAVQVLTLALHVKDAKLQPTLDAILGHAATAHPAAHDAEPSRGQFRPMSISARGRTPHPS